MIFGNKILIEDYVVEVLDKGHSDGPSIVQRVLKRHGPATKQAIYKALRKLMEDEVINKQGARYSLNRFWLQKIRQFSNRHIVEASTIDKSNILDFEDGDTVVYTFKSPYLLDITWGHLSDILFETVDEKRVMLNYHPHEWLMLSRTESEKFWLSRFNQDKKMICFTIGGSTLLDKKFQSEYSSEYIKVNLGETYGLKQNQYLSVQGDYVFEITTDEAFEKRVHTYFESCTKATDVNDVEIAKIAKYKYRSKLKLSKNKKKADMWRRRFGQDYHIPKPYYLFEGGSEQ